MLLRVLPLFVAAIGLSGCDLIKDVRDALPSRNYYAASTSMEPTIPKDARFAADVVDLDEIERGDIVVVRSKRGGEHIVRLIGFPGDRIEVDRGVIILNGEAVPQRQLSTEENEDEYGVVRPRTRISERLPGSARPHQIFDERESPSDFFGEIELPADHYFLMGDNRDNAADSRFNDDVMGLGLVRGEQILRRVDMTTLR